MTAQIFDPRHCTLGEGALWHPERAELFWFDIPAGRLMWRGGQMTFDGPVSAAGWIDHDHLLVASHRALHKVSLTAGTITDLIALEADIPTNRSNDGRADPHGGFWIGTMSRNGESGAGALYRYADGELRQLRRDLTTPNAICFTPDGRQGYHSDTRQRKIWRWDLDAQGWPIGAPDLFLDLSGDGLRPDGAITDADGALWVAQWAAGRVAQYGPDGRFITAHPVPAPNSTCPAFGGPDLRDLFITTAREKTTDEDLAQFPDAGAVFRIPGAGQGRAEPPVRLAE